MEQISQVNFNKFAIPVRMGLIITLIKVIINTIGYQFFAGKWGMSMMFMLISLAIMFVLLVQTGKMQRKALGGYIDIKQAFQAIFVAALIVCVITSIYDVIYIQYINPDMMDKIKESSIATAEKWGAPQETLDQMEKQFDEQSAGKLNIGKQFMSLLGNIVIYGIFSFICAAIAKKNKPAHMA